MEPTTAIEPMLDVATREKACRIASGYDADAPDADAVAAMRMAMSETNEGVEITPMALVGEARYEPDHDVKARTIYLVREIPGDRSRRQSAFRTGFHDSRRLSDGVATSSRSVAAAGR